MNTAPKQRGSASLALTVAVVVLTLIALVLWQALELRGARTTIKNANARADQTAQALAVERQGVALANRAVVNLQNQLDAQAESSDALLNQLHAARDGVPDVRLPAAAGRVLRSVTKAGAATQAPTAAGRAVEAGSAADPAGEVRAEPTDESVSCAAVAEWDLANIEHVLKPNALQLEALQGFYNDQRGLVLFDDGIGPYDALEQARRELHTTATVQSLQAVSRLLVEREAELIEELAGETDACDVQARFRELRVIRAALVMPTTRSAPGRGEG